MQGFNRYYPPDYDPKDPAYKGNLNRLAGKAAQKPVVRFEMPFNIWCLSCDSHIAQGVRFNAHKEKTGNYFSSPIYSFTMKCHICTGIIVIATNPKETRYDVLTGAKKKAEKWNAEENGTFEFGIAPASDDPISKLEKDATQKFNAKEAHSHVSQLIKENERQWSDPYTQSQKLRRSFRTKKRELNEAERAREEVKARHGLGIDLFDPSIADRVTAKSVDFRHGKRRRKDGGPVLGEDTLLKTIRDDQKLTQDPFAKAAAQKRCSPAELQRRKVQTQTTAISDGANVSTGVNLVGYESDEESVG